MIGDAPWLGGMMALRNVLAVARTMAAVTANVAGPGPISMTARIQPMGKMRRRATACLRVQSPHVRYTICAKAPAANAADASVDALKVTTIRRSTCQERLPAPPAESISDREFNVLGLQDVNGDLKVVPSNC